MQISLENLYVDFGADRVKPWVCLVLSWKYEDKFLFLLSPSDP